MHKTIGILAHVDAGKTTLSEAVLFHGGSLRSRGRVDHQNTFLDTDAQEQARGITIFSGQASFSYGENTYHLIDTPGHVDFACEMERTLAVLDAAIVLVSASDGVQGHTQTIWERLCALSIPTLFFINKTDRTESSAALHEIREVLSSDAVNCMNGLEGSAEFLAERDEALLECYLERGFDKAYFEEAASRMFMRRAWFPVLSGSALHDTGVSELLHHLDMLLRPAAGTQPGAQVYGLRRDRQGIRFALLKVTGGTLHARDMLGQHKIGELRFLQGSKWSAAAQAPAGSLCAASGLSGVRIGQGLGSAPDLPSPALIPQFAARVQFEGALQPVLDALRLLEEENPALQVQWEESLEQLTVRSMGPVQLEILETLLASRFGLIVHFGTPEVQFLETIAAPVIGCGHFEPLRHYAEVHLELRPAKPGSGISFSSACPTDTLGQNWQNLVKTHVFERVHRGVLTGAPLTDVCVTLLAGRAHEKHTEGGDFREATYRAIRQGLMQAENILLEPAVRFTVTLPAECIGRLYADLEQMSAQTEPLLSLGNRAQLKGIVPLRKFTGYDAVLASYTHGKGSLSILPAGYLPCKDAAQEIKRIGYNPVSDLPHTPDSVFCSHGAGYPVSWQDAPAHMHIQGVKPT